MFSKKNTSKESSSTVKNVITINAYTDVKYQFKSNIFKVFQKLTYNKSNYVTSYLSNKDIINTTVSLSRSIPEEDIADILDIKAYEELHLDQASEYVISHREIKDSGEEREFQIFVAEPHLLDELYLPIKHQTKYIDLIVPAPLLYKTLYQNDILSDTGTQCFVYFTKQDAFVTLYNDGEYLYSKSIEFSLEQIYDKYCEIVGEKVDEVEFYSILQSEGLKTTNSEYQQTFMKIFGEVFITINDIIIYAKRAFQLENIDQIYIGSVQGPIVGLDEYSQNYLGLESSDLNFEYNINSEEWYTDQLQYMMLLSSLHYMNDEDALVNLTMFPRAPSFVNRASGQFIIATFAAISLGLVYPLVYLVGSYMNDAKIYLLKSENSKLQIETDKYKKILGTKKKEIDVLDKSLGELSARYALKTKTLESIYKKKVNYRLKSGILHEIADEVLKYDVKVDKISTIDNQLFVSLVSDSDRKLTELIKYISEIHFDDIKKIDIKRIEKNSDSTNYRGVLKVDLR